MQSLTCLPQLSSIDIRIDDPRGSIYADQLSIYLSDVEFIRDMRQIISLQRIYTTISPQSNIDKEGYTYWVWRVDKEKWTGHKLISYTAWDIMRDNDV